MSSSKLFASGAKMKTVLWVGPSNLGPYHLARYNSLADSGWDVHVLTCPVAEHFRPWKFDESQARFHLHTFPSSKSGNILQKKAFAAELLQSIEPTVAVFIGYASNSINTVALECRLQGIPRILNIIGNPSEFTPSATFLKLQAKRLICKALFPASIVPGIRARNLGTQLGISESRTWEVGNVVDIKHFWKQLGTVPDETGKLQFVYVGRISPEKNLSGLIDAYELYRGEGGTWELCIIGDGPERVELLTKAESIPGLTLPGWVSYDELPALLHNSGAFVLPSSYEPWGLVLNEAMAAGLPLIVSRNCGAYPELCRDGSNGLGINPMDPIDMAQALKRMTMLSTLQRLGMAKVGQQIISSFTWSQWTTGVDCALSIEIKLQTTGHGFKD